MKCQFRKAHALVLLFLAALACMAWDALDASAMLRAPGCNNGRRCTENELHVVCVNGRRCDPKCMVRESQCVENPYLISDPNATMFDEITCVDKPTPTQPPQLDANGTRRLDDPVAVFKNRTAWAFDQWWDWPATCDKPAPSDNIQFGVKRDDNHEYLMENVCVRGSGHLMGYGRDKANVPIIDIHDEVDREFTNFFIFVNNVDNLAEPPPCFVDANVILIGLDYRLDNLVHALHRYHQVALMQRLHYPKPTDPPHPHHTASSTATKPTIVGHIWLHEMFNFPGDAMRFFFPMMGDAWFSVFGQDVDEKRFATLPRLRHVNTSVLRNTMLCFKQVRLAHACTGDFCVLPFRDVPGSRYRLSFVTLRTPYDTFVWEWTRARFARCLGIEPKKTANITHPNVVVAYRSHTRRFSQFPLLANGIVNHLKDAWGAHSVTFVEHTLFTPRAVMELHMSADVLIGVFGGGMGWTSMLPRGGVVIEMVGQDFGCPFERHVHGFFNPPDCEYGGYAIARGLRHYHLPLAPMVNAIYTVSPQTWRFALDTAMCALKWEPSHVLQFGMDSPENTFYALDIVRREYVGLIQKCDGVMPNQNLSISLGHP